MDRSLEGGPPREFLEMVSGGVFGNIYTTSTKN